MPIVYQEQYGKHVRTDGGGGYIIVVPTIQRFVEADESEVRFDRVYVYGPDGALEHTYLRDPIGQRFLDNLNIADDPSFVDSLPTQE